MKQSVVVLVCMALHSFSVRDFPGSHRTGVLAGDLRLQFFITKESEGSGLGNVYQRRIRKEDLSEALQTLSPKHASSPPKVFLCGPPSMVDEVSQHLSELEVDRKDIKYEKWW